MSPETDGIYYNMLDAYSPFLPDYNFGVAASMTDVLLQSCTDTIHLLPALLKIWYRGTARGLCTTNWFKIKRNMSGYTAHRGNG